MAIFEDEDEDINEDALFAPDLDTDQAPVALAPNGKALGQARPTDNTMTMLRNEGRRLAMLKGKEPSVMDAIMAGLAAKTGRASTDPAAAFMDGFVTSGAAAWQGGKAKDDTDARFKRIREQLTEERKAENDERRTKAYEHRAYNGGRGGRGGRGGALDAIRANDIVERTIARRFSAEKAALDSGYIDGRRITPEQRAELQGKMEQARQHLLSQIPNLQTQPDAATNQAPPQRKRSTTPGPAPMAVPRHAPGPQSARSALPNGMDRARATEVAKEALRRAGNDPVARKTVLDTATAQGLKL